MFTAKEISILSNMYRNSSKKDACCMLCDEIAINSHILQKNGVLNQISNENHLIQIKPKTLFNRKEKDLFEIKNIGSNNALTHRLFCKYHDNEVFKRIEKKQIDFQDYQSIVLLCYRSLCAELKKKMINADFYRKVLQSKNLEIKFDYISNVRLFYEGILKGISELKFFKKEFESEIFDSLLLRFKFDVFEFKYIPICASAVFSPIDYSCLNNINNKQLNYIYVNLIPISDRLILVLGRHNDYSDEWIEKYISDWYEISDVDFQKKLTELLATRIETWAISPSYFDTLMKKNIEKFIEYWNGNWLNYNKNQYLDLNIFEKENDIS